MENETVEEFRAKIKKLIDDVVNVDPSQKLPQKFNKQRRPKVISSLQSRANSGWIK